MSLLLSEAVVVVVEDDPNSLLATKELLTLNGVETIYSFSNGDSALDFLQTLLESDPNANVDLCLLDVHMPGETGYDIIERIRALPEAISGAKVVALTAGVLFDDIRRARGAGFDGFIGKPLKPHLFDQQLQRVLDGESVWEWR